MALAAPPPLPGAATAPAAKRDPAADADADGAPASPLPAAAIPLVGSTRFSVATLLFSGLCFTYMLRSSASVAIIPMGTQYGYDGTAKGWILSAFFVGYLLTNLLGGVASTRYGGWAVLLAGVAGSSLATLLCVPTGGWLPGLLLCRILVGAAQGLIYPSVHALASKWAPRQERATLISAVWSGGFLGPAVTMPLAGALVSGTLAVPGLNGGAPLRTGWPSVFLLSGCLGLCWCAVWYRYGSSSPAVHPTISPAERLWIHDNQQEGGGEGGGTSNAAQAQLSLRTVQWRRVVRHPAVAAIVIAHTAHNWGLYTLISWLPSFLHSQLGYDLKGAGAVAVAPYLARFVVSAGAGVVADRAIRAGVPVLTVRKAAMTVAEVLPAVALMASTYASSPPVAVALLSVAVGFGGACTAGFASNHMDVSPPNAGLLLGLSNTVATFPGIIAPVVVGALVNPPHDDLPHWRAAFGLSAAISLAGWAGFLLLARGSRQRDLDVLDGSGGGVVESAAADDGAGADAGDKDSDAGAVAVASHVGAGAVADVGGKRRRPGSGAAGADDEEAAVLVGPADRAHPTSSSSSSVVSALGGTLTRRAVGGGGGGGSVGAAGLGSLTVTPSASSGHLAGLEDAEEAEAADAAALRGAPPPAVAAAAEREDQRLLPPR